MTLEDSKDAISALLWSCSGKGQIVCSVQTRESYQLSGAESLAFRLRNRRIVAVKRVSGILKSEKKNERSEAHVDKITLKVVTSMEGRRAPPTYNTPFYKVTKFLS